MTQFSAKVLLIEDNPVDAELVKGSLALANNITVELSTNLADGIKRAQVGDIDLILLDLTLPDSEGVGTFLQTYFQLSRIPIIVITGLDDMNVALSCVRAGAQDYLVKGEFSSNQLLRSVFFAVERDQQQLNPLAASRPGEADEPRPDGLPELVLNVREPSIFDVTCSRYAMIVGQALKQRKFRIVHDVISPLTELAELLFHQRSGPADLEAVHVAALERLSVNMPPDEVQNCVDEGQLVLLELHRQLIRHYRDHLAQLEEKESGD